MNELGRIAGEQLLKYFQTEKGRQDFVKGFNKSREALGKLGGVAGRATEKAVMAGAPPVAEFASRFADRGGLVGSVAQGVAGVPVEKAAAMAGKIANPVSQVVTVAGTAGLVGGLLTKPETDYTNAMSTVAAREAAEYGIIDAKLQADAERQLGNERLAARKFEQSLYLQEQRQQHEMMMAQARAEARTPMNQPMSGSKLFDPMSVAQSMLGTIPQY